MKAKFATGVMFALGFLPAPTGAQTIDPSRVLGAFLGQVAKEIQQGARMMEETAPIIRRMAEEAGRTGRIPPEFLPDPHEKRRQEDMLKIALELRRMVHEHGPQNIKCVTVNGFADFEKEYPKLLEFGPYVRSVVEIVTFARGVAASRGINPDEVSWPALKLLCQHIPPEMSPVKAVMIAPLPMAAVPTPPVRR